MSYTAIAFLVIMLLSAIIGTLRGFIKTLFSLLSTIGAIALTVFVAPYLSNVLGSQSVFQNMGSIGGIVAYAISFIVIFLVALLVLKIICSIINRVLSKAPVLSKLNRFLGLILNMALSFFLCLVVAYFIGLFGSTGAGQAIIADAHKDALGSWLFDNNWIDQLMQMLASKNATFAKLLEMLQQFANPPAEEPPADVARLLASVAGAI